MDELELIIADNGIGLPKNIYLKINETIGLQLVYSLVKELNGKLKLDMGHGTEFKITFKELEYEERLWTLKCIWFNLKKKKINEYYPICLTAISISDA